MKPKLIAVLFVLFLSVESVSGSFGMLQRLIYAPRSGGLALTSAAMLSLSFTLFHREVCAEPDHCSQRRKASGICREISGRPSSSARRGSVPSFGKQ